MSTYHTVMTFLSSRFSVRVMVGSLTFCFFFFFNDTATTEIYTLSLHDALPIWTVAVGSGTWEEAWACALERPWAGVCCSCRDQCAARRGAARRAGAWPRASYASTMRATSGDLKSTRLNSIHVRISYVVFSMVRT